MNGKRLKQDLFACFLFIVSFFIIYFILTKNTYLYGSSMDWESQHYLIPEYFRNLFYSTKDLFPDFALNLGAGQNIYYMSYYGLYSPLIGLSYLLPFVKMINYIQFLGILIPISSTILFYFYLRKHYSFSISLFIAFMFLCSSPIIFHSHRHLMFISYMPFYIMALYGLDSYIEKKHMFLLGLSCFLIAITSYYYSVGSFISLFLYGIYLLYKNRKLNIKEFFKFMIPFIVGISSAMVLFLPTLYALLSGRDVTNVGPSLISLITPKRSLRFLLYNSYSIGLTVISFLALIHLLFKKKEDVIFGIILLLMVIFPICNFILNGTLYIDSKALIPFLPIILIITGDFIFDIIDKKISKFEFLVLFIVPIIFTNSKIVYIDLGILFILFLIYFKFKKFYISQIIFMIICFGTCIGINMSDKLSLKTKVTNEDYKNVDDAVSFILENSDNLYRINDSISTSISMNRVTDMHEYKTTIYSSTFNKDYNNYFYEFMNNPIPFRNKSMTPSSSNLLFQIMMGEKYIITNKNSDLKKIYEKGNVKVYENDFVLPIGYVTDSIGLISNSYPNNVITSIGKVGNGFNNDNLEIEKINFNIDISKNVTYIKENNEYIVNASKDAYMEVSFDNDYSGKLLFLRMKNNYNPRCGVPELWISINGIKNKLSCTSWKYHNQNFVFDYVLKNPKKLKIHLGEGKYHLSDFEAYSYDYSNLNEVVSLVSPFIFDKEKTNGDKIIGTVDASSSGYFVMSIPYDKGFKAYVDNKKVEVKKINSIFLGFPIEKGYHDIVIIYEAPLKFIGLIISIIGIIGLSVLAFVDKKCYNQSR